MTFVQQLEMGNLNDKIDDGFQSSRLCRRLVTWRWRQHGPLLHGLM